ncbi:MAG: fluoride efflux transporter CrcB [Elainellaceae cyanobacterium]
MVFDSSLRHPIAIGLGAIAGALSRYYLTLWCAQRFGGAFPYGTFLINLTGCLGMGFFVALTVDRIVFIPVEIRLMVATGFLGAYTTFSTYGLESNALLRAGSWTSFGWYWGGSAVLGMMAVQLGRVMAQLLAR